MKNLITFFEYLSIMLIKFDFIAICKKTLLFNIFAMAEFVLSDFTMTNKSKSLTSRKKLLKKLSILKL